MKSHIGPAGERVGMSEGLASVSPGTAAPPAREPGAAFESFLLWSALAAWAAMLFASAALLPYFDHDELTCSEWSRLIATDAGLVFPTITPLLHQRPLLYVVQGWLWLVFGHSEPIGRVLSAAFLGLLLWAVHGLVARVAGRRAAILAVLVLLGLPGVQQTASLALTDIPVGAMAAAAGLIAFTARPTPLALVGLAAAATATILAKPSGWPAMLGLMLAVGVAPGLGRARSERRPLLAISLGLGGAALHTLWLSSQLGARATWRGALSTIAAPTYLELADRMRMWRVLTLNGMGSLARVPLGYAIAFLALRPDRGHARPWARNAPVLAGGLLAAAAVAASFLYARSSGEERWQWTPSLLALAWMLAAWRGLPGGFADRGLALRLAAWAAPVVLAWLVWTPYASRLLSPAWAPLAAIAALVIDAAMRGWESRGRRWIARLAPVALWVVAVNAAAHLAGVGPERWLELLAHRGSGPAAVAAREDLLDGSIAPVRRLVEAELDPGERLVSPDGRFRYHFPGRAVQAYPGACDDLAAADLFVLPTFPSVSSYFRDRLGIAGDPAFWEACTSPRLERIGVAGSFVVYRVHPAMRRSPSP